MKNEKYPAGEIVYRLSDFVNHTKKAFRLNLSNPGKIIHALGASYVIDFIKTGRSQMIHDDLVPSKQLFEHLTRSGYYGFIENDELTIDKKFLIFGDYFISKDMSVILDKKLFNKKLKIYDSV